MTRGRILWMASLLACSAKNVSAWQATWSRINMSLDIDDSGGLPPAPAWYVSLSDRQACIITRWKSSVREESRGPEEKEMKSERLQKTHIYVFRYLNLMVDQATEWYKSYYDFARSVNFGAFFKIEIHRIWQSSFVMTGFRWAATLISNIRRI